MLAQLFLKDGSAFIKVTACALFLWLLTLVLNVDLRAQGKLNSLSASKGACRGKADPYHQTNSVFYKLMLATIQLVLNCKMVKLVENDDDSRLEGLARRSLVGEFDFALYRK